jgi:hypothetical protein
MLLVFPWCLQLNSIETESHQFNSKRQSGLAILLLTISITFILKQATRTSNFVIHPTTRGLAGALVSSRAAYHMQLEECRYSNTGRQAL